MSHLKAIKQVAEDQVEYALILEDDMYESFSYMKHWCVDLKEIINTAPKNWSIIQLYLVNYILLPKLFQYEKLLIPRHNISKKKCWGANAYLISKKYAKFIASMYVDNFWYLSNPHFSLHALSDHYLYGIDNNNSYICTKPLFIESVNNSTLHDTHYDNHIMCKFIYIYQFYKYSNQNIDKQPILNKILEDFFLKIYNSGGNRYKKNMVLQILNFFKTFI